MPRIERCIRRGMRERAAASDDKTAKSNVRIVVQGLDKVHKKIGRVNGEKVKVYIGTQVASAVFWRHI